jgi:flagellar biosynthesis protein FliQ
MTTYKNRRIKKWPFVVVVVVSVVVALLAAIVVGGLSVAVFGSATGCNALSLALLLDT